MYIIVASMTSTYDNSEPICICVNYLYVKDSETALFRRPQRKNQPSLEEVKLFSPVNTSSEIPLTMTIERRHKVLHSTENSFVVIIIYIEKYKNDIAASTPERHARRVRVYDR